LKEKIKVIIFGCGVMGRQVARILLDKESFEVVGAIDIDPELVGWDLGDILGIRKKINIKIEKEPEVLFSKVKADAVVHTTTSYLEIVLPQITKCLNARLNVVSTCEELSYPWRRHPEIAKNIDKLAKEKGVTAVGTGINPGYLMDTLPLILTSPSLEVKSVRVTRMMNSAKRRIPFQEKVGTGLTQEEFRERIEDKSITGHVGLLESLYMIADGLGWELDGAIELPPEPVVDEEEIETGLGAVKPGNVIGLTSVAYGQMKSKEVIRLEFCANAAVDEEYDEIIIEGEPKIHQKIIGGVHGDIGTVAVTINTIPRAIQAPAGLLLMKDLPLPHLTL